jgi:2-isopropylmalate synthase
MDEQKWLNDNCWLTEFNWLKEVRKDFELPEKVWIHDCTLREAEQAPGIVLNPEEKIALAKASDKLGVSSLEIFPVVSPLEREVAKEILKLNLRPVLRCLARWLIHDIDVVLECGAKAIHLENTANPWNNNIVYGLSEEQIIAKFVQATRYAKDHGLDVTVMPWDTYRCPLPYLEKLYKSIVYEGGADRIVVADSSGIGIPWATAHIIRTVRGWVPGIPVEMHAHNEMGLATACMLSAVIAGASGVHTTLCGYGTRGGNAATEEVVMNLELLLGVKTGVDLSRLYYTCKLAQDLTKIPVTPSKAVIGDNLYTYSTGISIDLFEKTSAAGRPQGYVPINPAMIGRPGYEIALGKMAGKSSIKTKLKQLGIEATPEQISVLTERVKQEGSLRKGSLSADVFRDLIQEVIGRGKQEDTSRRAVTTSGT